MDPFAETDARELRIFLESVLCDLCRFLHAARDGVSPAETQIHQEVRLGPGAFADIRVAAGGVPPYFIEIDVGYSRSRVIESMRLKYAGRTPASEGAAKVIVVVDRGPASGSPPPRAAPSAPPPPPPSLPSSGPPAPPPASAGTPSASTSPASWRISSSSFAKRWTR